MVPHELLNFYFNFNLYIKTGNKVIYETSGNFVAIFYDKRKMEYCADARRIRV